MFRRAPNQNGASPQCWVIALFDGRVKGVEISVGNAAGDGSSSHVAGHVLPKKITAHESGPEHDGS
jgi:hypothetical protein